LKFKTLAAGMSARIRLGAKKMARKKRKTKTIFFLSFSLLFSAGLEGEDVV
jgi:hypothetical protein